jgi:WD40 repeat protein
MNDHADSPRASQRWWLRTTLARLAFGASTRDARASAKAASPRAAMPGPGLDDPAQRQFGDYELLEVIGQGGMGTVYRARQRGLDREVAIKLLSAGREASEEFVDSFRHEAQNAALLQHPNIVVVHEMGECGGLIYYAMQLVRGHSLSQRLAGEGRPSPREAAALLRTIAEAVDYAHRLGVLHLDLKPGNILLAQDGTPLVADFGLARRLEQALDNESVAGTPSYMAPEQAQVQGTALSPATDVWALGAVLYELLTGQPPFDGGEPAATLRLLLDDDVCRPSRLATVPRDLEAICLKCLDKDPARRYPGARALADDLGRFLEGRAVSVRPLNALQRVARWARREPRLASAAALAIAALLAGVVATSLQWRRAQANAATASTRLWETRRDAALQLEQDGKGHQAMPRLLQNIEEQERAGRDDLVALDRRRLGLLEGQGAVLVDAVAIADANPLAVELSNDGTLLAMAFNDQSVRWYDTASLRERGRVSLKGKPNSEGQPRIPILLRFVDNHRLRATFEWYSNLASPDDGDTWLIDLDRRTVVEPPAAFADFADAIYSADGRHALLRNHRYQVQLWQVAPWRPMSPLSSLSPLSPLRKPDTQDFLPWLLGPGGSFAVSQTIAARTLLFYDLPDLTTPHLLEPPGNTGISAWALSPDGRTLAVGDFEGRMFVVDTSTRAVRTLASPRGREITWFDFSAEGDWLAAGSRDGTAYAFDVRSGDSLVSGQMRHDFPLQRVGLDREHRLLVAAGEGQTALWHLPLPGPSAVPAQRVGAGPAPHGLAGRYPIGWSLQAGLLASAGIDGQVRLWRLPMSPIPDARPAPQVPERTWFNGRRLVDVAWNLVRLLSLEGAAPTRWLTLPQPPGFAELVDGGRTVLVTTGPQLRILDGESLRLRFAPIALPDSPQRLLANADGSRVVLSFGTRGEDGFEERLRIYDARNGRRLPGEAFLAGPLHMLVFSPGDKRVLAVGPADAATTVLATAGLRRLAEYPHDPFQPVLWAAFDRGRDVMLVTHARDPRLGEDALLVWDPVSDVVRARHGTGQARPLGVIATAVGPFVAGANYDLLDPGGTHAHPLAHQARSAATAVLATSPDGRIVAHAFAGEVQLRDVATGAALGRPLQGGSGALDVIHQLSFSDDGHRLLARTTGGQWLLWPIRGETRPARDLLAKLARLGTDRESQQALRVPGMAERAALRRRDPGRWPAPAIRPSPPIASRGPATDMAIPARAPGTPDLLLDLGTQYNFAPDTWRNSFYNIRPNMRPYPGGVQRMAGIDYDLRGMVQLGTPPPSGPSSRAIDCQPVPPIHAAALHLLVMASLRSPDPDGRTVAYLRLRYRDGSSAVLPIRTGSEVPGFAGQDQTVPSAFAVNVAGPILGLEGETLSAPRLANPHPERLIRCLDLHATAAIRPLLVFAITVEPVTPRPFVAAAVIAEPVSRISHQQDMLSRAHARTPPP